MRVHMRFDGTDSHTRVSLFVNGAHCGELVLRPVEAIWLHHILLKGCQGLRRPGDEHAQAFTFISSGTPPTVGQADIDAAVAGEWRTP